MVSLVMFTNAKTSRFNLNFSKNIRAYIVAGAEVSEYASFSFFICKDLCYEI